MEEPLLKKYPVLDDIRFTYTRFRSKGMTREQAISEIIKAEDRNPPPYEEILLHRIAIADTMAEHRELTKDAALVAEEAFDEFLRLQPKMTNVTLRCKERILQPEHFGKEASYPPWEEYRPDWKPGDLFIYRLEGYYPKLFHMEGKLLLIYMTGDRPGEEDFYEELVYLSLCEPDTIPQSCEELNALGFLPGYTVFREYQYLYALSFKREKELDALRLQKVGNYPGTFNFFRERPAQRKNPLEIYPVYSGKSKITLVRAACAAYQHFGLISNEEQANLAKKQWNYGAECRMAKGESPIEVEMEKMPLPKLLTHTFFHHFSRLSSMIPHKSTMIPDD